MACWLRRSRHTGRRSAPRPRSTRSTLTALSYLGLDLRTLYERAGVREHLLEAADAGRAAVAATPAGHLHRGGHLSNLVGTLNELFTVTGDSSLAVEAVKTGRAAVAATPLDGYNRGGHLANLGIALEQMASLSTDVTVIAEAVQAGRAAVDATPPQDPRRSGGCTTSPASR